MQTARDECSRLRDEGADTMMEDCTGELKHGAASRLRRARLRVTVVERAEASAARSANTRQERSTWPFSRHGAYSRRTTVTSTHLRFFTDPPITLNSWLSESSRQLPALDCFPVLILALG